MEKLTQLTQEQLIGYVKKQKLRIRQLEIENESMVATNTSQSEQLSNLTKSLDKLKLQLSSKTTESSSSVSSFFGINLGSIDVLESLQQLGQSLGDSGADEPFQLVGQSYEKSNPSSEIAGDNSLIQKLQREVDEWRTRQQETEALKKKLEMSIDSLTIEKNSIVTSYETAINDMKTQLQLSNQALSDYKKSNISTSSSSTTVDQSVLEKQVKSLTARLNDQDSVIIEFKDLSAKYASLQHELTVAKNDLESSTKTTKTLRAQLVQAESATITQNHADLELLHARLAALSQDLSAEKSQSSAAKAEFMSYRAVVDEHYIKQADAFLQITEIENKWRLQLTQLQSDREALSQMCADLQVRLDEQRSRNELTSGNVEQELTGLRSIVGHLKQEIVQLQDQLTKARSVDVKSIASAPSFAATNTAVVTAQATSTSTTDSTQFNENIAKLKSEIELAENKLKGMKNSGVGKNNKNFKAVKSDIDRLTKRLQELETSRLDTHQSIVASTSATDITDGLSDGVLREGNINDTPVDGSFSTSLQISVTDSSSPVGADDERTVLRLEICSLHERLQEVQRSFTEQLLLKESDISILKQSANDKAREVNEASNQIDVLREKLSTLETTNAELIRNSTEFDAKILLMKTTVLNSEKHRENELETEIETLKNDIRKKQDYIRRLEMDEQAKRSELLLLEETHAAKSNASNKAIAELKLQVESLTTENKSISKRSTELVESFASVTEQLRSGDSDQDLLRSRIVDVERVSAEYSKENKGLQKKIEQLSLQLENTQLAIDTQKDESLQDAEAELKKLKATVIKLTDSNTSLESVRQEDEEKITALSDKVARLKTIVAKYKSVTQEKDAELDMYLQATAQARRFEIVLVVSIPLRIDPRADHAEYIHDELEPEPIAPSITYCLLSVDESVKRGSVIEGLRWEEAGKVKKWIAEGSVLLGSWPEDIRTSYNQEAQTKQKKYEKDRSQAQQELSAIKSAFEAYKVKAQESFKRLSEEERANQEQATRTAEIEVKSLTQLLLELEQKHDKLSDEHILLVEEHNNCPFTLDQVNKRIVLLEERLLTKDQELDLLKEQLAMSSTTIVQPSVYDKNSTRISDKQYHQYENEPTSPALQDMLSPLSDTTNKVNTGNIRAEHTSTNDEDRADTSTSPKWITGTAYIRPNTSSHHAGKDTMLRQQVSVTTFNIM